MNPLSTWLRDSGLAQYLPLFEQHGIDLRSLPLLSDADLAELGVPLGHRRLLLKAVADLGPAPPLAENLSAAQGDRTPRLHQRILGHEDIRPDPLHQLRPGDDMAGVSAEYDPRPLTASREASPVRARNR